MPLPSWTSLKDKISSPEFITGMRETRCPVCYAVGPDTVTSSGGDRCANCSTEHAFRWSYPGFCELTLIRMMQRILASSASKHKCRNILTSMKDAAEMLNEGVGGKLNEPGTKLASVLLEGVENLTAWILQSSNPLTGQKAHRFQIVETCDRLREIDVLSGIDHTPKLRQVFEDLRVSKSDQQNAYQEVMRTSLNGNEPTICVILLEELHGMLLDDLLLHMLLAREGAADSGISRSLPKSDGNSRDALFEEVAGRTFRETVDSIEQGREYMILRQEVKDYKCNFMRRYPFAVSLEMAHNAFCGAIGAVQIFADLNNLLAIRGRRRSPHAG